MDQYFYIKSPANHYDLKDCFNGVYIEEKEMWRFDKSQKELVLDFLACSSDEEDEESLSQYMDKMGVCPGSEDPSHQPSKKLTVEKKSKLRRARSFNEASSSSSSPSSSSPSSSSGSPSSNGGDRSCPSSEEDPGEGDERIAKKLEQSKKLSQFKKELDRL